MTAPATQTMTRFSIGTGDRFGMQGNAQLAAVRDACAAGVDLAIVWNKSHREHLIVGTTPQDVRSEADNAIHTAEWSGPFFVDADHINLTNVGSFLTPSDFFTIDVADFIGKKDDEKRLAGFVDAHFPYQGKITIPGIEEPLTITREQLRHIAETYLFAAEQAHQIYHHIAAAKAGRPFITEVSMDETDTPQSPLDLYFILAALAGLNIPVDTIAPKFSGRFNKGIDYRGDVQLFNREFNDDVCVLKHAVERFGLPEGLKLSVHSGSDKFAIYPGIRQACHRHNAGVHVKTAGTTWLEELIGLAESGDEASRFVKRVYRKAYGRFDELCRPYAAVIEIDPAALPVPEQLETWTGSEIAAALRHDVENPAYNCNVRQLLHVGYKIAAEDIKTYRSLVKQHREIVAEQVKTNLYARHIKPLFL